MMSHNSSKYSDQDLISFWKTHDAELSLVVQTKRVSLRHDLYRTAPWMVNYFFDFAQKLTVRTLLKHARPQAGQLVLDIGCGTGRWARMFQGHGLLPVGLDVGQHALRTARELGRGGLWVRGWLPSLGFKSSTFDWAISVAVMQHLPYDKQLECVHEVYRVLKRGGRFIVIEMISLEENAPYIFPRPRKEWESLFSGAGFVVVTTAACERVPWLGIVHALKRGSFGLLDMGGKGVLVSMVVGLLFVACAFPAEMLAAAADIRRWARYGGWLLTKE